MLSRLSLLSLRFSLEVLTPARLPPYKGNLLRQALLWHLGPLWCRNPGRCRDGCAQPETCLFGRLIEPLPNDTWTEKMQRLMGATPPPAYVLWDMQDRRRAYQSGDTLSFELTLIGETAIRQQPAFVAAVLVAGERGLGRGRLKAHLMQVEALTGPDAVPQPFMVDGAWQGALPDTAKLSYQDGVTWAEAQIPEEAITKLHIRYLNPLKIKVRGNVMRTPDFSAVMRAVVRRLRILSQVHGAGEWPRDAWGPLLDLAETVRLEHHETMWLYSERHSRRGTMPLEGLVGQAEYTSGRDLRSLLPALWLGQWVHIGKAAVWGNGRYEVAVG